MEIMIAWQSSCRAPWITFYSHSDTDHINPFSRSSRKEVAPNLNVTQLFVVVVVCFLFVVAVVMVCMYVCACVRACIVCMHACMRACVCACFVYSYRVKNCFPYRMLIRYKLHKRSLKAEWLEVSELIWRLECRQNRCLTVAEVIIFWVYIGLGLFYNMLRAC